MIKYISILFVLILLSQHIFGRQTSLPLIDTSCARNWPIVSNGMLSNDGEFASYTISNANTQLNKHVDAIFKKIGGKWEKKIEDLVGLPIFTEDSKLGIVLLNGNKLCIQELGSDKRSIISDVRNFMIGKFNNQQCLIIEKVMPVGKLLVINIASGTKWEYDNVISYTLSKNRELFAFTTNTNNSYSINVLGFIANREFKIWTGVSNVSNLIIEDYGRRICFINQSLIWQWDRDANSMAERIVTNKCIDGQEMNIGRLDYFSPSGKILFFRMQNPLLEPNYLKINSVRVFTYQDAVFDMDSARHSSTFLFAYKFENNQMIRLEYENDHVMSLTSDEKNILISHGEGDISESYWNERTKSYPIILNLETERRWRVKINLLSFQMSHSGKYLVGKDKLNNDLVCISFTGDTVATNNLTKYLSEYYHFDDASVNAGIDLRIFGWSSDEEKIIAYDSYDIWQLDPHSKLPPINLTNGYGRKNNIVFRFFQDESNEKLKIENGRYLIISAFNNDTKDNGFYRIKIGGHNNPTKLTMGPYVYIAPEQNVPNILPVKASNKDLWLVSRMSAKESPNFFWTRNFKQFYPISNNNPERNFQWYTTELINFYTSDGVKSQAILYKPDNFDPQKKYPVLFNFYQQESSRLNVYCYPRITDTYCFNYPMMLSQGYLICLPDIHFAPGETAKGICDAVEGAARYLSRFSYVDQSKLGLCGASFGGYAVNCIVTFTNRFAAAVSISGISDLFSCYGNVPGLRDEEIENRQFKMEVSLSTDPYRYLRNSPVAFAKQIKTPLLIVNTLKDYNVNVQQGTELFLALRREGNPAWMLVYQEIGHGIRNLSNNYDLYTRMNQFYGHYLKEAPAPIWMTKGISNTLRGIISGFEFDKDIQTPQRSNLYIPW